jgi:hypothetical protein
MKAAPEVTVASCHSIPVILYYNPGSRLEELEARDHPMAPEAGTGLAGPQRMLGDVFQDNYVAHCPFGVGIGQRAGHALLIDNCFQWVDSRLVDRGQETTEINSTVRDDEHYTPERGPIR